MEEKELAEVLSAWFKKHKSDTRYSKNPVWEVIRDTLQRRGNWKYKERGNMSGIRKVAGDDYWN